MNKLLDNVYRYSVWIITALAITAYLAYKILKFDDGSISSVLSSWDTWTNLAFIIFLNLTVQVGAIDSGISNGLESAEFQLADKLNNKIIISVNNEMDDFRAFIKKLNLSELKRLQEDYLFSVGDKRFIELTEKELKKYRNLKPIQHNIYGFNLPLFYEMTRDGVIKYAASFNKNQGKYASKARKIAQGVLFGAMTINVVFNATGIGAALISVMIISIGLMLTFLMSFVPQTFKLRYDLPKKVLLKSTLYNSYIDYKQGTHKLIKIYEEEIEEESQIVETEEIE